MCGWRVIIQVQRMDYEQLYAILPKSHWLWTVQDTREWLNYIGLHSLQAKFEQSSVDGSILDCLSENDLIDQLGISSKIIVKKLMNWIRNGLPAFDKYVEQRGLQLQERSKLETNKMSVLQRQRTNFKEQPIKEQRIKPREPSLTEQPKRAQANELIIRNVEQNQTSNYYLKEKGGSIGRQASNEIVIMDQFVSRHHAEIIYERERYYIRDCASSSGTFIKIIQKMELKSGMIIEMGSNQFQISIDAFNNLSVLVIDGPNLEFYKEFKDLETYSFGRKESNFVSFPDDQHLSGIHSKIFKLKGKWYIEDIATTNGTWFRLSPEGVQSEPFLLQDKSQFKLSSNLIYECILNTNNRRTHKSAEEKCCYCRLQEKNAMIIPCKHAIGCYECLLRQKECPMCETPITDIVKIFTA